MPSQGHPNSKGAHLHRYSPEEQPKYERQTPAPPGCANFAPDHRARIRHPARIWAQCAAQFHQQRGRRTPAKQGPRGKNPRSRLPAGDDKAITTEFSRQKTKYKPPEPPNTGQVPLALPNRHAKHLRAHLRSPRLKTAIPPVRSPNHSVLYFPPVHSRSGMGTNDHGNRTSRYPPR